jgi:tight adherence protein C
MLFLPLAGFIFISLLVAAAAMAFAPNPAAALERRLGEVAGVTGPVKTDATFDQTVIDTLKKMGNAIPQSTAETGKLRQRLVTAGYRSNEAVLTFLGIRVGVALALFAFFATPIIVKPNMWTALAMCGLGYVVPGMVLARMAKARQHRIRLGLPDALDLLVVSVEAGLGLDQAIQRVADELTFVHPDVSDELRMVNLELRAGKARTEALRNLGGRTQVDDVTSLVAMLIQTDKFGTSVAQSLRVHSDTARTKRRQRAEEAAAKTGVKMVFPLVFCIFPAIWVVAIGPAAIKFVQILLPMAQPK